MKHTYIFIISCLLAFNSIAQDAEKTGPVLQFLQTTIDYDTIERYSDGTRTFVFYNTGDEPLVTRNVKSGCSCTVPSFTKDTIFPGQKGGIKARFNTRKPIPFNQKLKVYSNSSTGKKVEVTIKGVVIDPKRVWGIEPKK
jgi:hypothetical protein